MTAFVPAHEDAQLLKPRLLVSLFLVIILEAGAFPDLLEMGLELLKFHRALAAAVRSNGGRTGA